MNKQTLVVVVGAIVLLGLGIFGAMAFTKSDDSNIPMMTMHNGSTMPTDQMTTSGMDTTEANDPTTGMNMTP